VDRQTQALWVLDGESKQLVNRQVTFTPGLYKIFDEIIVNAADNKQRDPTMNKIEVHIDAAANSVRVWNNGRGIPVVVHKEHQIYVPELIFGHLLTGSNFDDEEEKTTGGRNGYGAKLANIFSTKFIVETADSSTGQKFKQVYENNMGSRSVPDISKHSGSDFTSITFFPDLKRFKMTHLDEDTVALLSKRVYDIAGTNTAAGAKLNVYLNGALIHARTFEQYVGLYKGLEPPCAFERVNDRWEIGVGISDGTFQQVSFVNSISTTKGGTHVNYIADQITAKLMGVVKKKNKGQEVKQHQIKGHLTVYVNALIVNPAFDSQTKENMTTKHQAFGSTCVVPDKLLKQIEKSGIIDNILSWAKFKQNAELKKKSGSKRSKLIGITKLDDANFAGTAKSKDCTLILTEGDSAKALAISGLGVVGRDYYGVFPLKGKLLNVREAAHAQMMKNEEVQNIVKILGLTFGKEYDETSVSALRYGHLMIMADQDHDGSHIKGLLINFIHHFWPSLLKVKGFLQQFITPIVKCTKGKKEVTFFTIPEYTTWKEEHDDGRGWKIKYYKGLGTSTSAEAKEYFSHLETHEIDFAWDARADDVIDMAFAKKRVEDRKLWLLSMEPGVHIDYNVDSISYDSFINKELILFSHADNERSIPHFMDGLKPSQRKVLFACFKRNLKQEIKVAQLAGYVSEHSAYHHGEASLTQTIISMAQNYVGSNNINLLSPCGQFGTRLMGGKDAASPRYVFTKLEPITRCIYHPHDDPLLSYLDDDGQSIEPTCYVPVIPMVLVNGSDGIGTGWSSTVPTYNPREVIANLRAMLQGEEPSDLAPWFRGFTGEVAAKTPSSFSASGIIEADFEEGVVVISELPVGKWTTDYKQFLESMMIGADKEKDKADKKADKKKKDADEEGGAGEKDKEKPPSQIIKDFKENHTDTTVLFTINVPADKLADAAREKGGLEKKFKMDASIATSNMHMFDLHGMIRKYESPLDIMRAFYDVRVDFYGKRKDHLSSKLTEEWEKLDNKVRFIVAVCEGKLKVSNRKKDDLLQDLRTMGYKAFVDKKGKKGPADDEAKDDDEAEAEGTDNNLDKGYDYLLSMKIWSLTMERVQALTAQRNEKRSELDALLAKTPESLWLEDLDALELALDDFEAELEEAKRLESKARKAAGVARSKKMAGKPKAARKAKKAHGSDSDDDDDDDEEDASDFSEDEKPVKKAPAKPKNVPPPKPAAVAAKPKPVPAAAAKKAASPPKAPAQPDRPLTLQERLALIKAGGPLAPAAAAPAPAAATAAAPAPAPVAKAAPVKKAPVAAAKPAAKPKPKAKAPIDLCDSDDDAAAMNQADSDEEEEAFVQKPTAAAAAAARAPRQAAKKPVVYSLDSDDDEENEGGDSGDEDDEDEEEDEEDFSGSEDDESDFDDDEDSDDSRPKGKSRARRLLPRRHPPKRQPLQPRRLPPPPLPSRQASSAPSSPLRPKPRHRLATCFRLASHRSPRRPSALPSPQRLLPSQRQLQSQRQRWLPSQRQRPSPRSVSSTVTTRKKRPSLSPWFARPSPLAHGRRPTTPTTMTAPTTRKRRRTRKMRKTRRTRRRSLATRRLDPSRSSSPLVVQSESILLPKKEHLPKGLSSRSHEVRDDLSRT